MAEIKSHEFEGFLQKNWRSEYIFLSYGPDHGLVSERALLMARKTGIKLDDPFAVTKLEASELQRNPGQLIDEMNSIGLFGGEKLVWIRSTGTEKALVDSVSILCAEKGSGSKLIIEAGDLKKTSALRKSIEASNVAVAIPCYQDDPRQLSLLIDQELAAVGLAITADAREKLLDSIGGDRIASRNEIKKLALYCLGEKTVELQHVVDIVGDASAISVDEAVDAILSGDADHFLLAINKITVSKTAIFLVLQACLKQFQLLDVMRAEMDLTRSSASQVMGTLGRHIHFKRKPILEKALRDWSQISLQREMNRLQAAILQTRQRQSLEDSIATHTLLSTTIQSARNAQK